MTSGIDPFADVRQAMSSFVGRQYQLDKDSIESLLTNADALLAVVKAAQALDLELGWSIRRISKPESITGWRLNLLDALTALPEHLK